MGYSYNMQNCSGPMLVHHLSCHSLGLRSQAVVQRGFRKKSAGMDMTPAMARWVQSRSLFGEWQLTKGMTSRLYSDHMEPVSCVHQCVDGDVSDHTSFLLFLHYCGHFYNF